jgi:hypothetical protein
VRRYRFELAGPADDADLRHVLAATPMPGAVAVAFRREPSYFAAARVDGRFRQVVAAREAATGQVVGFGSRSVQPRYVNGRPGPVGYLSSLRVLEGHRNRGLVPRGYAFLRRLHSDGRARLYLTTIAEGNRLARALLTSGRSGLPAYHDAGRYHTAVLPVPPRRGAWRPPAGLEVRPARPDDLAAVLAFLEEHGPRRQFFPVYEAEDFGTGHGIFKDLRCDQLLLAFRGGSLVGTLAGWDQSGFRQTVVHGYGRALRLARPLVNLAARCRGLPPLPAPGEGLRCVTAALPVLAGDDPAVFAALVEGVRDRAARGGPAHLMLGLHEGDPLLPALLPYRATWYTTRLYLVCWDDGESVREALDGRVPYLELGSL